MHEAPSVRPSHDTRFAMVACSGSNDDATTATQGEINEVATTTPGHKEGEP